MIVGSVWIIGATAPKLWPFQKGKWWPVEFGVYPWAPEMMVRSGKYTGKKNRNYSWKGLRKWDVHRWRSRNEPGEFFFCSWNSTSMLCLRDSPPQITKLRWSKASKTPMSIPRTNRLEWIDDKVIIIAIRRRKKDVDTGSREPLADHVALHPINSSMRLDSCSFPSVSNSTKSGL